MLSIPSEKGTYAIYVHLPRSKTITIGKLGRFNFSLGAYIYVGSAFSSGGLRPRLERHIYGSACSHWHIDYLRRNAEVRAFCYLSNNQNYECRWVQALSELSGSYFPVPGFGSSDCHKCQSHLIAIKYSDVSKGQTMYNETMLATIQDTLTMITELPPISIKCLQIPSQHDSCVPQ